MKKSNKPIRSLSQRIPKTSGLSVAAPVEQNGITLPPVSQHVVAPVCCILAGHFPMEFYSLLIEESAFFALQK